jgi:hypothetical protein
MRILLAGVTLDLIIIVANGGYMPVLPAAVAATGYDGAAYQMQPGSIELGSEDIVSIQRAPLWMLARVLVIPEPFSQPTAMSIGAMLVAVGVFMYITWTARRYARRREQR